MRPLLLGLVPVIKVKQRVAVHDSNYFRVGVSVKEEHHGKRKAN